MLCVEFPHSSWRFFVSKGHPHGKEWGWKMEVGWNKCGVDLDLEEALGGKGRESMVFSLVGKRWMNGVLSSNNSASQDTWVPSIQRDFAWFFSSE